MECFVKVYFLALAHGAKSLHVDFIQTKLGEMFAMSDENQLYFLRFVDHEKEHICRFCKDHKILIQNSSPITSELNSYYSGTLQEFTTPYCLVGTPFAKTVWHELSKIPYGQTCSYKDIAQNLGNSTSYRAVANANAANPIAIIVPCHRVIRSDGSLGGYNGCLERKQCLIEQEKHLNDA